jgi:4-amino-4-deoxy-L-arabinose transferase-like glycosyltransferase
MKVRSEGVQMRALGREIGALFLGCSPGCDTLRGVMDRGPGANAPAEQPRARGGGVLDRRGVALAAVLAVAFGLRLAWALGVASATRWRFAWDASSYDRLARELVEGKGFLWLTGEPTAFLLPGYPFVLAGAYWLFGDDLLVAKLLNVVLATLTCFFTYRIGLRAYGPRVGLLAAAIFAVFPGDIYFASTTLSEVFFVCVLCGSLCAWLAWSDGTAQSGPGRWLLLGALSGIAALTRGVAVFFPVVFAAAWLLDLGRGWVVLQRVFWLVVGMALAIAPWTIRNQLSMGSPILLSTGGGYVLFNSHSPMANGAQLFLPKATREKTFPELVHLRRPEQEVAFSKAQTRYALEYAWSHPLRELRLAPARLYHLYRHDHAAFDYLAEYRPERRGQPGNALLAGPWRNRLSLLADGYFFTVAAIALVGFVYSWSRAWRRAWVLPLTVAYFHLVHAFIFLGQPRYHAPLVPLFSVLAALALARGGEAWGRGREARRPVE